MANIIDTHSHLADPKFDNDRHDVIRRAQEAGIVAMIAVADTLRSIDDVVDLARQYDVIYPTAGIHCHYAESTLDSDIEQLENILHRTSDIVAVGETGIDLFYGKDTLVRQTQLFETHVKLSLEFGLPLVIHCRDAEQYILDILSRYPDATGVFHCFSGNDIFCRQVVDIGFYVSFSGIVTFKNAEQIRKAVLSAPVDKILVETDCPYLAPQGYRGNRNEPSYILKTVECIAETLQLPFEDVARKTTENARILFGIGR
ncbi:MAG: TatD family hydrolase [Candidatus Auribacterota bacterium]|jgi:TatD DNase family protein|nr:TatD family hydrolase [Candidatus Auribacterota bacterium]